MSADPLLYMVSAARGHAHTGASFTSRGAAIDYADGLREDGWWVNISIYGEVEGFELSRALARPEGAS
jgi:hypothetical protein